MSMYRETTPAKWSGWDLNPQYPDLKTAPFPLGHTVSPDFYLGSSHHFEGGSAV